MQAVQKALTSPVTTTVAKVGIAMGLLTALVTGALWAAKILSGALALSSPIGLGVAAFFGLVLLTACLMKKKPSDQSSDKVTEVKDNESDSVKEKKSEDTTPHLQWDKGLVFPAMKLNYTKEYLNKIAFRELPNYIDRTSEADLASAAKKDANQTVAPLVDDIFGQAMSMVDDNRLDDVFSKIDQNIDTFNMHQDNQIQFNLI